MKRKICILATHHAYRYEAPRLSYLQNVKDLLIIHSVDLIAEEATGVPCATYTHELISKTEFNSQIYWKNVDLTVEERRKAPDINAWSIGTPVDFELHNLREWVWVIRTSEAMKNSALLICGYAHTFSIAEKFQSAGFEVEVNVYFDKADEERITSAQ